MRSIRQRQEHQGSLGPKDKKLVAWLRRSKRHTTTLEICMITGCISARDKIRKLKASGINIGPAKFLHKSKTGAYIFGWKLAA